MNTESQTTDSSAAATHENRVCIIGCGAVGMASAYALIQSSFIRELVLVGRNVEKTDGEVMDLEQAISVPMKSPIEVINGSYADAAASSIVVITAGEATKGADTSRLDLLAKNAAIIRDIVGKLMAEGFKGVLVVASNPVDLLTQVAQEVSGLPAGQVIGTGTLVDTARLRGLLAAEFGVEPRAVEAFIIGEHGDSEIAVWSGVRVGGVRLDRHPGARDLPSYGDLLERIRRAAPEIVKRKGRTEYAIGLCVQRICEAVLRNEHAVLSVSTLMQGEYGLNDVYLGTPCVVGKNGVERAIELELDESEREGLHRSSGILTKLYGELTADRKPPS